ncbi:sodium-dependent transporter [Formosa sp. Hel1_33_131]|uniref:bile acid:sodium symporter family protein n=1 Tax=Formosa sp. Hel1_33_131 TaxID=1336794 RepID=UPI00084E34F2|nr:bile acid:sodium symporter family protein [Formosa sp. Hel1_33_131]AOR28823.1 sodium-dependent transporter [Formosa sp. Hel1_33_131]
MDTGTIILAIALIIIMFGMGLSLVKDDFIRLFQHPKAVIVGLVNQIILLPVIAYVLISLLNVETDIAIGIMILAACPGGPTSNLITYLAKGDIGLSISLTTVNSLITIFTIPFVIDFALNQFLEADEMVQINKLQTVIQIFVIVIIPVSLGMALKNAKPIFADKMNKPVKIASGAVLFLVIIGLVIKKKEELIPYLKQAGLTALVLNIATMLVGLATAKIAKLSLAQSRTISIESGIQNGTMAIAIASGVLMNDNYAIAPAVYSLIMFFTGGVIIAFAMNTSSQK